MKQKKPRKYRLNNEGQYLYNQTRALLRACREDVERELLPIVKRVAPDTLGAVQDSWVDDIVAVLDKLKTKWLGRTRQFKAIAGRFVGIGETMVGIDVFGRSQRMSDYLSAVTRQNVALIESIPTQYHQQVENIIIGNLRQGQRSSYIVKELSEQFGIRERHAKMIARDQSSKIRAELNRVRQIDQGYEYFKWETSHDERVRETHSEVSKRDVGFGPGIFRWDDPPIIEGRPLLPGMDYNCRCNGRPYRYKSKD